jgi:hypothetical protein
MSEKRKLILNFAWDCFLISSLCAVMIAHTRDGFILFFSLCWFSSLYLKKTSREKPLPKMPERELTGLETVSWFAIGFAALWILGFALYKGLLGNPAFVIPAGFIALAVRSLLFAKALAALKMSALARN